jgi:hypothetical protein
LTCGQDNGRYTPLNFNHRIRCLRTAEHNLLHTRIL